MYYTPGWAILLTSTVGVVGVAGTLTAAWLTQHQTNYRFNRERDDKATQFGLERRDSHYQYQREAIAEVVALVAGSVNSVRLVSSDLLEVAVNGGSLRQPSGDAAKALMQNSQELPVKVARAQLIISEPEVLAKLNAVEKAHGDALRKVSSGAVMPVDPQLVTEAWKDECLALARTVERLTGELVVETRSRLWSE